MHSTNELVQFTYDYKMIYILFNVNYSKDEYIYDSEH